MDNVTHTLFAVTLARTPLGRAGRGTTAALVIASNAPDIDIVTTLNGGLSYLQWHRGPTHGALGILILGIGSAALVWMTRRCRFRESPASGGASFAMLAIVGVIGTACHVLMDFPTSFGTRLLSPFGWRWFALDWLPIVDIYLLIILTAGLMFGRRSDAARRRNAGIALVLMAANYGVRGAAHHQALARAPRAFGRSLPERCDPAATKRAFIESWPGPAAPAPADRGCLVDLAAIPTFFSPFEWRLIARLPDGYETHEIDVFDRPARGGSDDAPAWRVTRRYPNRWDAHIAGAATTRLGRVFLGFSRFPAARRVQIGETGETIIRFTDVRFAGAVLWRDQPVRPVDPFTATIRFDRDGQVLEERLGR